MVTISIIAALGVGLLVYLIGGRNWLKTMPWSRAILNVIEPMERALWNKSETILFSRLLVFLGLIPPLLMELEKLNIPMIADLVPEQYKGWWTLAFTAIGILNEMLRNRTTKPIELVDVPDNPPPALAATLFHADIVKQDAVALVAECKAEGKV